MSERAIYAINELAKLWVVMTKGIPEWDISAITDLNESL